MKNFFVLALSWLLWAAPNPLPAQATAPKTLEFKNGKWFTNAGFMPGTWYSVNGVLTQKVPVKVDSVVDLANQWVIPPMGDAFSGATAAAAGVGFMLDNYWQEGVFYLQFLGNNQEQRAATSPLVNRPNRPDAIFANGGITCTLGKPFPEYEGPANNLRNPMLWKDRFDDFKGERKMSEDGYWFVDDKKALEQAWPKLLAQKPEVLSIYLLDAEKSGGKEGKGLTPEMAKLVLKKAHKANLRVFAHVETAEDLRLGLKIGVDGFANLPGHQWDGQSDLSVYELNEDDLKKLAKKRTPLIPLLAQGQNPGGAQKNIQAFHARTLRRCFDAGVMLAIGSNDIQRTSRSELNYWFGLGNLNHLKTLQVLCENTPMAIFPNRKIGKIAEGYEANFIVLREDPSSNVLKIRMHRFKVKNGVIYNN